MSEDNTDNKDKNFDYGKNITKRERALQDEF